MRLTQRSQYLSSLLLHCWRRQRTIALHLGNPLGESFYQIPTNTLVTRELRLSSYILIQSATLVSHLYSFYFLNVGADSYYPNVFVNDTRVIVNAASPQAKPVSPPSIYTRSPRFRLSHRCDEGSMYRRGCSSYTTRDPRRETRNLDGINQIRGQIIRDQSGPILVSADIFSRTFVLAYSCLPQP